MIKLNSIQKRGRMAIALLISSVAMKIVNLITGPIFTRLMNTAEYGVYGTFKTWSEFFIFIATLDIIGMVYAQGLVKFSENRKEYSKSIQSLMYISTGIFFVIFVFATKIWTLNLNFLQLILILIITICYIHYECWACEKRNDLSFKSIAIVTFLKEFLKQFVGVIAVYYCTDKVNARIISWAAIDIICSLIIFISQKDKNIGISKKYWKYTLSFVAPLIIPLLLSKAMGSCGQIIISEKIGASEAGIYSISLSIGTLTRMFNDVIMQTLEPWIYKKMKENKINSIWNILRLSAILIGVINLGVILVVPEAIKIFAPVSYYAAIDLIPVFLIMNYIHYLYVIVLAFEKYTEKLVNIKITTSIWSVICCVLSYFAAIKIGYVYVGWILVIYYFGLLIINLINLRNEINFEKNAMYMILSAIIFTILGVALKALYSTIIIRFVIVVIILLILFINRKVLIKNIKPIINKGD